MKVGLGGFCSTRAEPVPGCLIYLLLEVCFLVGFNNKGVFESDFFKVGFEVGFQ